MAIFRVIFCDFRVNLTSQGLAPKNGGPKPTQNPEIPKNTAAAVAGVALHCAAKTESTASRLSMSLLEGGTWETTPFTSPSSLHWETHFYPMLVKRCFFKGCAGFKVDRSPPKGAGKLVPRENFGGGQTCNN